MIIRVFNKSYLVQYFLLVLLQFVLWFGAFLNSPVPEPVINEYLTPGYTLLYHLLGEYHLASTFTTFFIILFGALAFNYSIEKQELSSKNALFPAFFFILVMSIQPSLFTLHQALIPLLLFIILMYYTFAIYSEEESYIKVFNSGFLIAVGSMFYLPFIYFLAFFWLTFISYRIYKWREWIIVLLGFLTPYILLFTYYFWIDELFLLFDAYANYFTKMTLIKAIPDFSILDFVIVGMVILLFFNAFARVYINLQENVINVRKRYWSASLLFIVSVIGLLISGKTAENQMVFLFFSMAIIIVGLFSRLKRYFWTELYVILLLILVILNNYSFAFNWF